ncbi:MAG: 30S ribosomal protein S12 methylthiotransferase RimO [Thermoflexus sp.]|nr:30S ribosomal protein S12 methylthiotransferase RimO [Thermoflexus sp.]
MSKTSGSSKRYYLITMGCAKNAVDSAGMAELLERAGYESVDRPVRADVLIVNTCGFIEAARQESLRALRELAARKKKGQLLIAAGCLAQRWGARLVEEVPGIDGVIGTRRWMDILEFIERLRGRIVPEPLFHIPEDGPIHREERGVLRAAVQGVSAYLKIADGCRRPCAFCAIPLIKGPAVSRPPEVIWAEARRLVDRGVRELILIAQDTTDYGHDLGMRDGLPILIEGLVQQVPEVKWIRVMYAYPGAVSDRLIETMARYPQVAHYLDLPLQHGHPAVLRRMRRPANIGWVYRTIEKLRRAMPDIAIRTTFIVGYPGETEEEFETLLRFIQDLEFDRIGCFTYSYEPETPSARQPGHLPEEIKRERYERLMAAQQPISLRKNQALVGKTLEVLIEGVGDGLSVGRTYRDAPEIDGLVLVEGEWPVGQLLPVRITGAMTYDLIGVVEASLSAHEQTSFPSSPPNGSPR